MHKGRIQELFVISPEASLYGAISPSNKPAAKDSQRWVRKDICPSIHSQGGQLFLAAPTAYHGDDIRATAGLRLYFSLQQATGFLMRKD
jgi:prophage antirepressor-like protein